ncbi:hypothetical protein RHMOL_Rhmol07G0317800 [Rhododendron molle]|uniref:Uncharacterized protein n=1 Tax=Rhododendron molle TaxID=49168 RepID=A0ACC0N8Z1_RHOML|nr:hypothetical protein RHMOL_Rhmol07G0317800 [Rhododendron molle]
MDVEIPTRATAPSSRFALWNHVVATRYRIWRALPVLIALSLSILAISFIVKQPRSQCRVCRLPPCPVLWLKDGRKTSRDGLSMDNGSPIPVPYRSLEKEKSSDSGVNFASAGCGILDWTHPPDFPSCTSLSRQIQQLFDLDLDSSSFRKAVFFISVGGNDYQFSYRGMASLIAFS